MVPRDLFEVVDRHHIRPISPDVEDTEDLTLLLPHLEEVDRRIWIVEGGIDTALIHRDGPIDEGCTRSPEVEEGKACYEDEGYTPSDLTPGPCLPYPCGKQGEEEGDPESEPDRLTILVDGHLLHWLDPTVED